MKWFLPFYLGVAAVLQAGLNRQVAKHWGLAVATLFNNFILFSLSIFLLLVLRRYPQLKLDAQPFSLESLSGLNFSWWFLLPGLFGFTIVLGVPATVARLGALKVFVGLIGAQLLASIVWDVWVEAIPITPMRILGSVLALTGAVITLNSSQN